MQPLIRSTKQVAIGPETKELSLTDLWLVIRKRRVLLLCMALGIGALAGAAGLLRGKRYTATGEVQIQPGSGSALKESISAALGAGTSTLDVVMESDIRILESDTLLTAVAQKLNLASNPEFMGGGSNAGPSFLNLGHRKPPALHGNLDDPLVRAGVLGNLRGHLTLSRVPRTQMITISYSSASPQLSAEIVNALENEFVLNNFSTHFNSTQQVSKWLTGQMDDLRVVVQDSQNRMVDLQRKLGVMALDPDHSLMVQEIGNLQKNAADAAEQRVLAEARYRILRSLPPDQIQESPAGTQSAIGNEGMLASLRAQRASVEADLAKLQPVYGPNYPEVKQLRSQRDALSQSIGNQEQRVVAEADDALSLAKTAQNQAQAMLNNKVHDLYGQRDDLVQYMLLSQEYDSNRKMYESIVARLREALSMRAWMRPTSTS